MASYTTHATVKLPKLYVLRNQTIQTFPGGYPTHYAINDLPVLEKQKGWPTIHIESFRHIRTVVDIHLAKVHMVKLCRFGHVFVYRSNHFAWRAIVGSKVEDDKWSVSGL